MKIFEGRIDRLHYFLGLLLALLPLFFVVSFWGLLNIFYGNPVGDPGSIIDFINTIIPVLIGLGVIVEITLTFALVIRRSHDFGQPSLLSLLLFIPTVNAILLLLLIFIKGNKSDNEYGSVPDPNRKFLADVFNY